MKIRHIVLLPVALGFMSITRVPAAASLDRSTQMQRLIRTFEGKWLVSEQHERSAWSPQGATGSGTAEFIRGPGSKSLIQTYRSSVGNYAFEGHGVSWWNSTTQRYDGIWCENTSRDGCINSGSVRWSGDQLVTEYDTETNGRKTRVRRTIAEITPTSFTTIIEMAIEDQPIKRAFTVHYRRQP